jgi:hypothetical protein
MLDVDGDGAASRKDMLLAFRRDRQLAGGPILCGGCAWVWTTKTHPHTVKDAVYTEPVVVSAELTLKTFEATLCPVCTYA